MRALDTVDLQIAQGARAFLAIWLEAVGRVFEFLVAAAHLLQLVAQEFDRIEHRFPGPVQRARHLAAAGQLAPLEQGGHHRQVGPRFLDAGFGGADAVADLQADVPAGADEALNAFDAGLIGLVRRQQQQIDVGVRLQLAAAIAADGEKRPVGRHREPLPEGQQRGVGLAGEPAQQAGHLLIFLETLDAGAPGLAQRQLQGRDGRAGVGRRPVSQRGRDGGRRRG